MKMMNFNSVRDKVAIVTGASRGIGRAIAECFGENGMKVVCAARSAEQGQAVADGICAKGGDAIFLQTDCSKASAIKELVDKTVAHYGKLDGVVSNAGIGMGGTPLHEYEVEDYEKIFSLNSEGVFAGMKYGAEAILKSHSEGGFLINVASVAGLVPQRGQALCIELRKGQNAVDFGDHCLRPVVPVGVDRVEGLAVFQQHIVHRPCVDGKALDSRVLCKGLPDALLHVGKQAVDVPFQMTVHPPDAIGKTVHFLGEENAVLHPSHNVPPAGRTNVDGKIIFLHNAPPVWL